LNDAFLARTHLEHDELHVLAAVRRGLAHGAVSR
jgi:hypothetical protein